MVKYEQILIDPSPGEVAECLALAAAAADEGERERLIGDESAKWRKFAREMGLAPEGILQYHPTANGGAFPVSQVTVAWWSDPLSRKHVVVRGHRFRHEETRNLLIDFYLGLRPPLWHTHPERVLRILTPEGRAWVCECDCGAVGTPETVTWMGTMCGPCSDREQDSGRTGFATQRAVMRQGYSPVRALAFDRTGESLAAVDSAGSVTVWRVAESRVNCMVRSLGFEIVDVVFANPELVVCLTPDGETGRDVYSLDVADTSIPPSLLYQGAIGFAACAKENEIVVSSGAGLTLIDARKGPTRDEPFANTANSRPFPSAGGDQIVLFGNAGIQCRSAETLELLSSRNYENLVAFIEDLPHVHLAFESSTRRYYFSNSRSRDLRSFGQRDEIALIASDRGSFVRSQTATGFEYVRDSYWTPLPPGVLTPELPLPAHGFVGMSLTADRKRLVAATNFGRLHIFDATNLYPLAAFDWHLGGITAMAVSPAQNLVATAGVEGAIKLWDLDRLLPAVAPP